MDVHRTIGFTGIGLVIDGDHDRRPGIRRGFETVILKHPAELGSWFRSHHLQVEEIKMAKRIEITMDEDVMSGDPCVAGTRICVETIIANLQAGHTFDRILASYPTLPAGGIEASIMWAEARGIDWRSPNRRRGVDIAKRFAAA